MKVKEISLFSDKDIFTARELRSRREEIRAQMGGIVRRIIVEAENGSIFAESDIEYCSRSLRKRQHLQNLLRIIDEQIRIKERDYGLGRV